MVVKFRNSRDMSDDIFCGFCERKIVAVPDLLRLHTEDLTELLSEMLEAHRCTPSQDSPT